VDKERNLRTLRSALERTEAPHETFELPDETQRFRASVCDNSRCASSGKKAFAKQYTPGAAAEHSTSAAPRNSHAPCDEIPSWALFYRICTALPVNETGTFNGPLDRALRYNR
jgi:hypothetical protein